MSRIRPAVDVSPPVASDPPVVGADARAAPFIRRSTAAGRMAVALEQQGFAIDDTLVDMVTVNGLRARLEALEAAGKLQPAATGRGGGRSHDPDVRGDRTRWLDDVPTEANEAMLAVVLESLRLAINRRLALGLFGFEGHYAVYPPGAGYARHRDRFADDDARVVSCVLYLNSPGWQPADGGALALFADSGAIEILPESGTFVAFLSDRFEHEVRAARRARRSIAGWFTRRRI